MPFPLVFDDHAHVLENRAIRYLFHPRVFLESEHTRSRPLPYVTFAISYALQGLSLSWLRVWSLFIHLGSAVLVGLLFRRWFAGKAGNTPGSYLGALLAAAIFLLHPLAADAVIYLSARGSVLALFFVLLALWFHGLPRGGWLSWGGFLLASVAAFLSRESAVALFPLLLLLHRLSGRPWKQLAPYVVPLLAGGSVLLWLKAGFLGAAYKGFFTVQGDVDVTGPLDYLRLSLSLWPGILELFVNPYALSIDHQVTLPAGWLSLSVLAGAVIWVALAACVWRSWSRRSYFWLAPSWLLLALLPTNTVFPLLDPFSERHFYLALPALAWGVSCLLYRWPARRPGALAALAYVVVLPSGFFFTLPRIEQWAEPSALWLDAHHKAPMKFRTAFNAAVSLISAQDDNEGALLVLGETFAKLRPGDLSFEQQSEGLKLAASAVQGLVSTRKVRPAAVLTKFPDGYWKELLLLRCSFDEKSSVWDKRWMAAYESVGGEALSSRARDPELVKNTFLLLRAEHLAKDGEKKEAAAVYETVFAGFSERHFPYWTAREDLGDLYMSLGREQQAVEQLEQAAIQYKVFKRFPFHLQSKLYALYLKHGDLPRATDAIGELVRVYTDDAALRRLYADLLAARSDRHAARQEGEAKYYKERAISPADEREILRP